MGQVEQAHSATGAEVRQFIERYERLEQEKKGIADCQKEVMAEAKGRGYDPKALRALVKIRATDPNVLRDLEAILELYKSALGMT
jgi:uncharacterized protein (UPF0335 family)